MLLSDPQQDFQFPATFINKEPTKNKGKVTHQIFLAAGQRLFSQKITCHTKLFMTSAEQGFC